MNSLELSSNEESIQAMISPEGEVVKFNNLIDIKSRTLTY